MPLVERPGLDLWAVWNQGHPIVIPTNIGWKHDGSAVMGRGLARAAASMFPRLPKLYGEACQRYANGEAESACVYYADARLYLAPSKPLNRTEPHLSWRGQATLATIHSSLQAIKEAVDTEKVAGLAMPLLGTGNGGLSIQSVYNLTVTELADTVGVVLLATPLSAEDMTDPEPGQWESGTQWTG